MAIIYGIADSEKKLLNILPSEVRNIDNMSRVKKEFEEKIANTDSGFFNSIRKWNWKRQVRKFEYKKIGKLHKGARGEIKVIEKLSKLDDNYHILCGLQIYLPYAATYNGRKNLRSAQMDVIVVCPKGVFMIEVKNWTDDFVKNKKWKFNPYEQTDRAGCVLWITMQNILKDCKITNILLSINGNLRYDSTFRFVNVSSLDRINYFLMSRNDILNQKEIKNIVKNLKKGITT